MIFKDLRIPKIAKFSGLKNPRILNSWIDASICRSKHALDPKEIFGSADPLSLSLEELSEMSIRSEKWGDRKKRRESTKFSQFHKKKKDTLANDKFAQRNEIEALKGCA